MDNLNVRLMGCAGPDPAGHAEVVAITVQALAGAITAPRHAGRIGSAACPVVTLACKGSLAALSKSKI